MRTTGQETRGGHWLSWLVGCVLVGWVLLYNALRLNGSTPAEVGMWSAAVGGAAGAALFGVGWLVVRQLRASGRLATGAATIPDPAEMDPSGRAACRIAWPVLAAMAVVALAVGTALAFDWATTDSADRGLTGVVLAGWNLLAAIWFGDEALRLRENGAEGVESLVMGAVLTGILAAIGLARGHMEPLQLVLLAVAAAAGLAAGLVVWWLRGHRGVPVAGPVAALVVVGALLAALVG